MINHCPPDASVAFKTPHDIEDFLICRMYRLAMSARRGAAARYARELGISRRDWRILSFVGDYSGCGMKELTDMSGIDSVAASRGVADMVAHGLVAKIRNSDNRRMTALTLTAHGQDLYRQAQLLGRVYNGEFAACLSDDEARVLQVLLQRLDAHAVRLNTREAGEMALHEGLPAGETPE